MTIQKHVQKQTKTGKRIHRSENAKITSVYVDKTHFAAVKTRAASLGLTVSKYFMHLANQDIHKGGPIKITLSPVAVTPEQAEKIASPGKTE